MKSNIHNTSIFTISRGRYRTKQKPKKERTFKSIIKEFAQETTFHGVQYIFKDSSAVLDRFLWLAMFLVSLGCATAICVSMVMKYLSGPTATQVKDTHYPLHLFPFPGVSICPTHKIKRTTALEYIHKRLTLSMDGATNASLEQFMFAMMDFRHPSYNRMMIHINNSEDILPQLSTLNLTDFMIHVLPTCEEMFLRCYWHGVKEECCSLFHLQRSEEGFCYSFNTLTSQNLRSCDNVSVSYQSEDDAMQSECVMRSNAAAGSTTGLEVFMNHYISRENSVKHPSTTGESSIRMQLHTSDEYPEAEIGVTVPLSRGIKVTTTIKAYLTESLQPMRHLTPAQRYCYFPDEIELEVSAQYSQRSCLIECRLNYFHKVCGCRPYYFNMLDNRIPICNALQLKCIAIHGADVRFYRPPGDSRPAAQDTEDKLNCTHCLPTCHENYFDDDTDITADTQRRSVESFGYLDLYYKYGGAVYYIRNITYDWLDLLVSIGGTAGLFLGISLLSVVELLYWLLKLTGFVLGRQNARVHPTSLQTLPKGLVYHRDFY